MSPKPNPHTRGILSTYCEYVGNKIVYEVPKFRQAARNLANYGLLPDQLPALLDWCRTTWAGKNGVDMLTAQMMYFQWVDSGRPGAPATREERIRQIIESTDPKYQGSIGARLRAKDIEAIASEEPDGQAV